MNVRCHTLKSKHFGGQNSGVKKSLTWVASQSYRPLPTPCACLPATATVMLSYELCRKWGSFRLLLFSNPNFLKHVSHTPTTRPLSSARKDRVSLMLRFFEWCHQLYTPQVAREGREVEKIGLTAVRRFCRFQVETATFLLSTFPCPPKNLQIHTVLTLFFWPKKVNFWTLFSCLEQY